MGKSIFHSSIEGGQHGPKGLEGFLAFAKQAGAAGAQPTCYMLENGKGGFKTAAEIKDTFAKYGLKFDGISCHCVTWVLNAAWTGSKTILPFLSSEVGKKSAPEIEQWTEDYLKKLMDLAAELKVYILPMFWGPAFGWELATGYPWGFFKAGYDLIKEGQERFVKQTAAIRKYANERGIYLAHEIHPGTAACCADDFNMLVDICDGDKCMTVNADPSHCWEGEDWETRFTKVGDRVIGCHVKNHVVHKGMPLRSMEADWKKRAMQFTDLPSGDLNLIRYAELMEKIGYAKRYCQVMGTATAPLVVEAESAFRDGDATSANGIKYVTEELCFPMAEGCFEDGLGAQD
ncbi:MAG: TIM barrel protein [Verrucomicrobia bacterium]|nr:TIM barrel protein [Verrucomicrobiota bacterium]